MDYHWQTLESKSKDLLPQIMDAVETLWAVKPQQSTQSDSRNPLPLSGSQATTSTSSSNTTTELAAVSASNKKVSSELGSLDHGLPIDIIPGLSVAKEDPATGGGGGESKSVKPKLKMVSKPRNLKEEAKEKSVTGQKETR